jgi:hypothetical protein
VCERSAEDWRQMLRIFSKESAMDRFRIVSTQAVCSRDLVVGILVGPNSLFCLVRI